MDIPGLITLPYKLERAAPPFETNAVKYPEALVRYFLKALTKIGDRVFDPFAGLGTTLFVAEAMRRVPYGIEADEQRHAWVAGQLQHWLQLVHGDSLRLAKLGLPPMDFCMTSPPFMRQSDRWNVLAGGDAKRTGYTAYLRDMRKVFAQVATVLKPRTRLVVQVDNLPGRTFTPLVHDLQAAISHSFRQEGEVIVRWTGAPEDYTHTTCLIFRK